MPLFTHNNKKKLAMTGLLNKLLQRQSAFTSNTSCIVQDAVHDIISDGGAPNWESSSELAEEDLEEQEEQEEISHGCPSSTLTSPYSLTSGPLAWHRARSRTIGGRSHGCDLLIASSSCCSGRSCKHHDHALASPSINSNLTSPSSLDRSYIWEEADQPDPHIHPSDHMKTLLSQLGATISASKSAFSLLQASSSPQNSAEKVYGRAVMAMAEELQTLSDLHLRLYSLNQQHTFEDNSCETQSSSETSNIFMGPNTNTVERQEAMLKSYEGVITRFYDEIVKKGATTEALKETLAKSMLNGEKLERRTKALEAKLSASPVCVKQ